MVSVTVQRSNDPSDVAVMAFDASGKKTIDLSKGDHWLSYSAVGARRSHMGLTAASGAEMRAVDRDLGADGRASGTRLVTVGMLWLTLCLGIAAAAQAQTPAQSQALLPKAVSNLIKVKQDQATHDVNQRLVALPAVTTPNVEGVALSIEATTTEKRGALAFVWGRKDDDRFKAGITLSGPLNDATKTAQPLDLNGLNSGATAEFGLHWFLWQRRVNWAEAQRVCFAATKQRDGCDDSDFTKAADRRKYLKAIGAAGDPFVIDITASTGRTQFSYLEKTTFASGSQSKNDAALAVKFGRMLPVTGLVSAGYAFAHEWKPGSAARQICQPIAGTTSLECKTSPVGAPSDSTKHGLTLEWRRTLASNAAIAPRVAWDVRSKTTTVSVPVYVFTNAAGSLTGGVKFGWNSKDRDLTAVLFIGPVFSMFK